MGPIKSATQCPMEDRGSGCLDQSLRQIEGGHLAVHRALDRARQEESLDPTQLRGQREVDLGPGGRLDEPELASGSGRTRCRCFGRPRCSPTRNRMGASRTGANTRSRRHPPARPCVPADTPGSGRARWSVLGSGRTAAPRTRRQTDAHSHDRSGSCLRKPPGLLLCLPLDVGLRVRGG